MISKIDAITTYAEKSEKARKKFEKTIDEAVSNNLRQVRVRVTGDIEIKVLDALITAYCENGWTIMITREISHNLVPSIQDSGLYTLDFS